MTEKLKQDLLHPIVENLKCGFKSDSSDYNSGVNDGMYSMGKCLLDKLEKAFISAYMHGFANGDKNSLIVDDIAVGNMKAAWDALIERF